MENSPKSQPNNLEVKPRPEVVYRGKMFEIVQWEGKHGVMFEAAVRAPGVRLLIETKKDGMKALLMTKENRREANGADYRLPGGKVFDSLTELDAHRDGGQDIAPVAMKAAQKEGKEEAGIDGGEFSALGMSKAGASVEWDLHYFTVRNAVIGEQDLEYGEQIQIVVLSAQEIFEKLSNGDVQEGRSAEKVWLWLTKNGFINFNK